MRKKIVHLITHDKFTEPYINFMKIYMTEYEHFFVISKWSCSIEGMNISNLVDCENIIIYENGKQLAFGRNIRKLVKSVDKIIVSGIFGVEQLIYFWPSNIYKKIYLHYWGGDFYQMRERKLRNWREYIRRYQLRYCFKKSNGAVFLIDGEYEKYKEITKIHKDNVFVAPMPYDTYKAFPFKEYRNRRYSDKLRIIIGNSATKENNHVYIFTLLQHLKGENIEIYCPLSYGDEDYKKEIEKLGKEIFGKKFIPVTKWMKKEEYYQFLATFDIGIFGNDRQQGMGNIGALLYMGKKIYLKEGTSMYDNYRKLGFCCYSVEELRKSDFEKISTYPERSHNIELADALYIPEEMSEQWSKVFES